MIFVWIFLALLFGFLMGYAISSKFRTTEYHGVIKLEEDNGRLVHSLILGDDPELLGYQKFVTFKVIAPDYERMISR